MKCNDRTCKNEATEGYKSCERCRRRHKEYYFSHPKKKVNGQCKVKDCPRMADPGYSSCLTCRERVNARAAANREKLKEKSRIYYKKIKDSAFNAYGGYTCACCGDTHEEFLSLDHVNGDGAQHRRKSGTASGRNIYYWLRDNGYPSGFRVLCLNCNFSLGHRGYCPHNPETMKQHTNLGWRRSRKDPIQLPEAEVKLL